MSNRMGCLADARHENEMVGFDAPRPLDFAVVIAEFRQSIGDITYGDDPILTHGVNGTVYERTARVVP